MENKGKQIPQYKNNKIILIYINKQYFLCNDIEFNKESQQLNVI